LSMTARPAPILAVCGVIELSAFATVSASF